MRSSPRILWLLIASSSFVAVAAQNISTSLQIPPLQWINLSRLYAGGSQPIPLRDSVISFDPSKRVLIIYGGQSSAGVATQQTYVLQMDTLVWRVPEPPAAQQDIPPARFSAVFGQDIASNDRNGILLYGGNGGSGNTPLSDLWYYHFQNEFWAQIPFSTTNNPLGRWGAVGGTAPASSIQNVETYMWLAGGVNQTGPFSYDEVWQLNMTGVIAAGSVVASGAWSKVPTNAGDPNEPKMTRYGLAGTVIPPVGNTDREGTLVVFGGCDPNSSGQYNATCAQNAANILTLPTSSSQTAAQWTTAADCPPGSYGATMAPNRNMATTVFNSQVFLFPGAVDSSRWSNTSGTQPGEVGILLATSGVWARVLPAGDPGSTPNRPSFKEGAAVYSHSASITLENGLWSDTVVFGGQDATTGEMTNELWLLRAYNGTIQSSSQQWSGYGNGTLQTGIDASGAGVTVQYLAQCATPISVTTTATSTTTSSTPTQTLGASSTGTTSPGSLLDGSPVHKILSPLSVALFLPVVILYRSSSGPFTRTFSTPTSTKLVVIGGLVAIGAYVIGVTGFVLGVTGWAHKTAQISSVTRRDNASSPTIPFFSTAYSKASFVLFVVVYGVLPLLGVAVYFTKPRRRFELDQLPRRPPFQRERKPTDETIPITLVGSMPREKSTASEDDQLMSNQRASVESQAVVESDDGDELTDRQRRAKSPSNGHLFSRISGGFNARRHSTATPPSPSPPPASYPPSKFEVVNRPKRASVASGGHHPPISSSGVVAASLPRNPSDLSWMERRRSVNMYGQLDYQLAQGAQSSPMIESAAARSSAHEMSPTTPPVPALTPPRPPSRVATIWFNVLLQIVILWALAFWIVTFALLPSVIGLALVAVAGVAFYLAMLVLAWMKHPRSSLLVVFISRLRGDPTDTSRAAGPALSTAEGTFLPVPTTSPGRPYLHSPQWRSTRQGLADDGLRSVDSDLPEDDEDDEERQARIEEEMARRDVSIFTVPKRKLVVRN